LIYYYYYFFFDSAHYSILIFSYFKIIKNPILFIILNLINYKILILIKKKKEMALLEKFYINKIILRIILTLNDM